MISQKLKLEREGLCFITKYGESYVIIEYKGSKKIKIRFKNGYERWAQWGDIKRDEIITPYYKSVFGVGYLGQGKYSNKTHLKIYKIWYNMLVRCYDPYFLNKYPTYIDCYVCEEWLCFQNFAKWYEEHVYNCNNERMCLDKDILKKDNKIYSPETCLIVPNRINLLFTKKQNHRGKYPIGVGEYYDKRCACKCLIAYCNIGEKGHKTLSYFPLTEPFHAFYTYKIFKENYIKEVADEYKGLIPIELYNAMYRWEVEIND